MSASSTSPGFLERRLAGEQQVLARPLRALVKRPAVVCASGTPLRDAVQLMHAEGVGSIVVVDGAGVPLGIFTTTDLLGAAAQGRDQGAVDESMAPRPFALPAHT